MKCTNAVPCHAKIIKSKSMQFYENCCTAESCCCRRRRRYSFDVLVHWSKSNNWFDVFTFHYSAYSILPFTFNSLKCAKLFNYCFDSFHSMTQFIRFILRLAIRSCRFIFNFKVGAMHLAFCISIFSLLLMLFVIFHSWSQLNAHRQAHIGAYVRTLFVKVFQNCSNSLSTYKYVFTFSSFALASHCLFSYFCLYIVRLLDGVCMFTLYWTLQWVLHLSLSYWTRWRWLVSRGSNHMHSHTHRVHIAKFQFDVKNSGNSQVGNETIDFSKTLLNSTLSHTPARARIPI